MSKTYYPIPSEIENLMESGSLEQLDSYINPGFAGSAFHHYSKKFLKVLAEIKIFTFKELKDAYDKCKNKKLSASARQRTVVMGHYGYYITELSQSKAMWDLLTESEKAEATKLKYHVIESTNDQSR